MALPVNGSAHLIPAYYSFIDPERMKGWVGLVGWPVADGLPTLVVTHQLQVERRTGKVRPPETDVLPLCHAPTVSGFFTRSRNFDVQLGIWGFFRKTTVSEKPKLCVKFYNLHLWIRNDQVHYSQQCRHFVELVVSMKAKTCSHELN